MLTQALTLNPPQRRALLMAVHGCNHPIPEKVPENCTRIEGDGEGWKAGHALYPATPVAPAPELVAAAEAGIAAAGRAQ